MKSKFTLVLICALLFASLLSGSVIADEFTHIVSNITDDSFSISWTLVDGATGYWILVGYPGQSEPVYTITMYSLTTSHLDFPPLLNSNTTYTVRVACEVNNSTMIYTTQSTFTTLGGPSDFIVDTETGTITQYTGSDANVTIPDNIDGTDILIIGTGAFDGCNTVETVTISSGITTIENLAFDSCASLASVSIPSTVNSIGIQAFGVCPSLATINVDTGNASYKSSDGVLFNNSMTTLIYYPSGKNAQEYIVPADVETIGEYAFYYNGYLSEVTMYYGVTAIQSSAFYGCMSLTAATIPSSVASIANDAFMYYTEGSSSSLVLPSLTIYGMSSSYANTYADANGIPFAQAACYDFTYTDNGDNTCMITGYKGDDTDVNIPAYIDSIKVTGISSNAFSGHSDIVSITIPSTVETIQNLAFANCDSLMNIYVSSSAYFTALDGVLYSSGYDSLICYPHAKDATSYSVPANVDTIGSYAFESVPALTSVTISGSTEILEGAFYSSINLESATIYDSVTTIADSAFMYYNSENQTDEPLPSLTIHGQAGSAAQTYAQNHSIPFQEIYEGDVYDYASLSPTTCKITNYNGTSTNIVIPDTINGMTVVEIGNHAFNKKNLNSVQIPNTVTSIREYAFCDNNIAYLIIGNNVATIETNAFSHNNIVTLNIPKTVTEIGEQAFACNQIETLTFPTSVINMGFAIFRANQITTVNGSPSNGIIYYRYEDGSDNLTKINSYGGASDIINFIPSTVEWIEPFAFQGCGITSLNIPDSIYYIGPATFNDNAITTLDGMPSNGIIYARYMNDETGTGAYNTTTIKSYGGVSDYIDFIPSSVTTIDQNAFQNNDIYYVELPESIDYIGHAAFFRNDITEAIVNNGVWHIGNYAFGENPLINIVIPSTVTSIDDPAFYMTSDELVIYGSSGTTAASYANDHNITFVSVEDFSYSDNGDGTSSITGYSGSLAHVYIPPAMADGSLPVTHLYQTFKQNNNVESVRYPNTLREIGFEAFAECNGITEVVVPDHIEAIGESVFMECDNLASVIIGDSVTTIGDYAFINCHNLENITFGNSLETIEDCVFVSANKLNTVTLPASLTSIGLVAFSHCYELKSILIPSNVSSISADAFSDSTQIIIVGTIGSYAQTYANANGIPFVPGIVIDLNKDASIDMLDIVLLAQNYGGNLADYDVNGDGKLNLFDIVTLARLN